MLFVDLNERDRISDPAAVTECEIVKHPLPRVPYPVGVKKAGMPAPPALKRSARVPC